MIDEPSSSDDETLPVVIGWRITGLLGAGGMGRVFRAECDDDGRIGALKILDARWSHDPVIAARFEAEASALRQLDHEHIVRALDTTESGDGRFCLVMEFVDGCDLGRLLRAEKLAPERASKSSTRSALPSRTGMNTAWCIATSSLGTFSSDAMAR